jgi:hypothetical protein
MKDRSQYALQYSGYPLVVAEQKKDKLQASVLKLTGKELSIQTTFIQQNPITNEARHWDINWFGSYE